ncbi:serum factor response D-like isoform X1 [Pecten maximus]|uniref:serum factor response D-like isoform X1 n=2 Tax=Pecten maximus TaxID=6579 RepID=UPI0014584A8E|nr:serum factor response D-like isoform X1 [Pecten maximus]
MSSKRDMLKYLTQKLKSQTLNEVQPYQEKLDDDHDSGTESDDENQDLDDEDPRDAMSHHDTSSYGSVSPVNHPPSPLMHVLDSNATHEISEHNLDSISCTSDFERHSLDFDRHSSEEELENIHREVVAEKRKWSQVNNRNCESASSSDEEVKELMLEPQPVLFRCSPPQGVHKLNNNSVNNNNNISNHNNNFSCTNITVISSSYGGPTNLRSKNSLNNNVKSQLHINKVTPISVMSVSPRKRHRQTTTSDSPPFTADLAQSATVIRRPCLDFEKMQVRIFKRFKTLVN